MKKMLRDIQYVGFDSLLDKIKTNSFQPTNFSNIDNENNLNNLEKEPETQNNNNLYFTEDNIEEKQNEEQYNELLNKVFQQENLQKQQTNTEKQHYIGHRSRVKEKFLNAEPNSFADYELMELILFLIIPRADTKQLAYKLLKHFGNIRNIQNASIETLNQQGVNGKNLKYIFKLTKEIQSRIITNSINDSQTIDSTKLLLDYLKNTIGSLPEEQLHILFLDTKLRLIADKSFGLSNVNAVIINTRELVRMALDLKATSIIISHNHPSGDINPSEDDKEMTDAIKNAMTAIDVDVIDHVIVSGNNHFSFAENDLL